MYKQEPKTPNMPGIPSRNYTRGPRTKEAIEADDFDSAALEDIELDLELDEEEEDYV